MKSSKPSEPTDQHVDFSHADVTLSLESSKSAKQSDCKASPNNECVGNEIGGACVTEAETTSGASSTHEENYTLKSEGVKSVDYRDTNDQSNLAEELGQNISQKSKTRPLRSQTNLASIQLGVGVAPERMTQCVCNRKDEQTKLSKVQQRGRHQIDAFTQTDIEQGSENNSLHFLGSSTHTTSQTSPLVNQAISQTGASLSRMTLQASEIPVNNATLRPFQEATQVAMHTYEPSTGPVNSKSSEIPVAQVILQPSELSLSQAASQLPELPRTQNLSNVSFSTNNASQSAPAVIYNTRHVRVATRPRFSAQNASARVSRQPFIIPPRQALIQRCLCQPVQLVCPLHSHLFQRHRPSFVDSDAFMNAQRMDQSVQYIPYPNDPVLGQNYIVRTVRYSFDNQVRFYQHNQLADLYPNGGLIQPRLLNRAMLPRRPRDSPMQNSMPPDQDLDQLSAHQAPYSSLNQPTFMSVNTNFQQCPSRVLTPMCQTPLSEPSPVNHDHELSFAQEQGQLVAGQRPYAGEEVRMPTVEQPLLFVSDSVSSPDVQVLQHSQSMMLAQNENPQPFVALPPSITVYEQPPIITVHEPEQPTHGSFKSLEQGLSFPCVTQTCENENSDVELATNASRQRNHFESFGEERRKFCASTEENNIEICASNLAFPKDQENSAKQRELCQDMKNLCTEHNEDTTCFSQLQHPNASPANWEESVESNIQLCSAQDSNCSPPKNHLNEKLNKTQNAQPDRTYCSSKEKPKVANQTSHVMNSPLCTSQERAGSKETSSNENHKDHVTNIRISTSTSQEKTGSKETSSSENHKDHVTNIRISTSISQERTGSKETCPTENHEYHATDIPICTSQERRGSKETSTTENNKDHATDIPSGSQQKRTIEASAQECQEYRESSTTNAPPYTSKERTCLKETNKQEWNENCTSNSSCPSQERSDLKKTIVQVSHESQVTNVSQGKSALMKTTTQSSHDSHNTGLPSSSSGTKAVLKDAYLIKPLCLQNKELNIHLKRKTKKSNNKSIFELIVDSEIYENWQSTILEDYKKTLAARKPSRPTSIFSETKFIIPGPNQSMRLQISKARAESKENTVGPGVAEMQETKAPAKMFYIVKFSRRPPVYGASETIEGILTLAVLTSCVCQCIRLRLQGRAIVWIGEKDQKCFMPIKKVLLQMTETLWTGEKTNSILQRGLYDFRFSFTLPDNLPSSYYDLMITIVYSLEIQLVTCPAIMANEQDQEHQGCQQTWLFCAYVYICGKPPIGRHSSYKPAAFRRPVTFLDAKQRVLSKVMVKGHLPRTVFAVGDSVELKLTLANSSEFKEKATLSVFLVQRVILAAKTHVSVFRVLRDEENKAKHWVIGSGPKSFTFCLRVGDYLPSTNVDAAFPPGELRVCYFLQVVLCIPELELQQVVFTRPIAIVHESGTHSRNCRQETPRHYSLVPAPQVEGTYLDEVGSDEDDQGKNKTNGRGPSLDKALHVTMVELFLQSTKGYTSKDKQAIQDALQVCEGGLGAFLHFYAHIDVGPKEVLPSQRLSRKEELKRRKLNKDFSKRATKFGPVFPNADSINPAEKIFTSIIDFSKLKTNTRDQRKEMKLHLKNLIYRLLCYEGWLRQQIKAVQTNEADTPLKTNVEKEISKAQDSGECKAREACRCKAQDGGACKTQDSGACKAQDTCNCKAQDACSCKAQDGGACKAQDGGVYKAQDACSCKAQDGGACKVQDDGECKAQDGSKKSLMQNIKCIEENFKYGSWLVFSFKADFRAMNNKKTLKDQWFHGRTTLYRLIKKEECGPSGLFLTIVDEYKGLDLAQSLLKFESGESSDSEYETGLLSELMVQIELLEVSKKEENVDDNADSSQSLPVVEENMLKHDNGTGEREKAKDKLSHIHEYVSNPAFSQGKSLENNTKGTLQDSTSDPHSTNVHGNAETIHQPKIKRKIEKYQNTVSMESNSDHSLTVTSICDATNTIELNEPALSKGEKETLYKPDADTIAEPDDTWLDNNLKEMEPGNDYKDTTSSLDMRSKDGKPKSSKIKMTLIIDKQDPIRNNMQNDSNDFKLGDKKNRIDLLRKAMTEEKVEEENDLIITQNQKAVQVLQSSQDVDVCTSSGHKPTISLPEMLTTEKILESIKESVTITGSVKDCCMLQSENSELSDGDNNKANLIEQVKVEDSSQEQHIFSDQQKQEAYEDESQLKPNNLNHDDVDVHNKFLTTPNKLEDQQIIYKEPQKNEDIPTIQNDMNNEDKFDSSTLNSSERKAKVDMSKITDTDGSIEEHLIFKPKPVVKRNACFQIVDLEDQSNSRKTKQLESSLGPDISSPSGHRSGEAHDVDSQSISNETSHNDQDRKDYEEIDISLDVCRDMIGHFVNGVFVDCEDGCDKDKSEKETEYRNKGSYSGESYASGSKSSEDFDKEVLFKDNHENRIKQQKHLFIKKKKAKKKMMKKRLARLKEQHNIDGNFLEIICEQNLSQNSKNEENGSALCSNNLRDNLSRPYRPTENVCNDLDSQVNQHNEKSSTIDSRSLASQTTINSSAGTEPNDFETKTDSLDVQEKNSIKACIPQEPEKGVFNTNHMKETLDFNTEECVSRTCNEDTETAIATTTVTKILKDGFSSNNFPLKDDKNQNDFSCAFFDSPAGDISRACRSVSSIQDTNSSLGKKAIDCHSKSSEQSDSESESVGVLRRKERYSSFSKLRAEGIGRSDVYKNNLEKNGRTDSAPNFNHESVPEKDVQPEDQRTNATRKCAGTESRSPVFETSGRDVAEQPECKGKRCTIRFKLSLRNSCSDKRDDSHVDDIENKAQDMINTIPQGTYDSLLPIRKMQHASTAFQKLTAALRIAGLPLSKREILPSNSKTGVHGACCKKSSDNINDTEKKFEYKIKNVLDSITQPSRKTKESPVIESRNAESNNHFDSELTSYQPPVSSTNAGSKVSDKLMNNALVERNKIKASFEGHTYYGEPEQKGLENSSPRLRKRKRCRELSPVLENKSGIQRCIHNETSATSIPSQRKNQLTKCTDKNDSRRSETTYQNNGLQFADDTQKHSIPQEWHKKPLAKNVAIHDEPSNDNVRNDSVKDNKNRCVQKNIEPSPAQQRGNFSTMPSQTVTADKQAHVAKILLKKLLTLAAKENAVHNETAAQNPENGALSNEIEDIASSESISQIAESLANMVTHTIILWAPYEAEMLRTSVGSKSEQLNQNGEVISLPTPNSQDFKLKVKKETSANGQTEKCIKHKSELNVNATEFWPKRFQNAFGTTISNTYCSDVNGTLGTKETTAVNVNPISASGNFPTEPETHTPIDKTIEKLTLDTLCACESLRTDDDGDFFQTMGNWVLSCLTMDTAVRGQTENFESKINRTDFPYTMQKLCELAVLRIKNPVESNAIGQAPASVGDHMNDQPFSRTSFMHRAFQGDQPNQDNAVSHFVRESLAQQRHQEQQAQANIICNQSRKQPEGATANIAVSSQLQTLENEADQVHRNPHGQPYRSLLQLQSWHPIHKMNKNRQHRKTTHEMHKEQTFNPSHQSHLQKDAVKNGQGTHFEPAHPKYKSYKNQRLIKQKSKNKE